MPSIVRLAHRWGVVAATIIGLLLCAVFVPQSADGQAGGRIVQRVLVPGDAEVVVSPAGRYIAYIASDQEGPKLVVNGDTTLRPARRHLFEIVPYCNDLTYFERHADPGFVYSSSKTLVIRDGQKASSIANTHSAWCEPSSGELVYSVGASKDNGARFVSSLGYKLGGMVSEWFDGAPYRIAVSPDASTVAFSTYPAQTAEGKRLAVYVGRKGKFDKLRTVVDAEVETLRLSHDGATLAWVARSGDGQSLVYRNDKLLAQTSPIPHRRGKFAAVAQVRVSPDGRTIAWTEVVDTAVSVWVSKDGLAPEPVPTAARDLLAVHDAGTFDYIGRQIAMVGGVAQQAYGLSAFPQQFAAWPGFIFSVPKDSASGRRGITLFKAGKSALYLVGAGEAMSQLPRPPPHQLSAPYMKAPFLAYVESRGLPLWVEQLSDGSERVRFGIYAGAQADRVAAAWVEKDQIGTIAKNGLEYVKRLEPLPDVPGPVKVEQPRSEPPVTSPDDPLVKVTWRQFAERLKNPSAHTLVALWNERCWPPCTPVLRYLMANKPLDAFSIFPLAIDQLGRTSVDKNGEAAVVRAIERAGLPRPWLFAIPSYDAVVEDEYFGHLIAGYVSDATVQRYLVFDKNGKVLGSHNAYLRLTFEATDGGVFIIDEPSAPLVAAFVATRREFDPLLRIRAHTWRANLHVGHARETPRSRVANQSDSYVASGPAAVRLTGVLKAVDNLGVLADAATETRVSISGRISKEYLAVDRIDLASARSPHKP